MTAPAATIPVPCRAARARRRGFTLVEVLVVIVLVAMIAAIVVPRLSGMQRRQFRLAADRVEDMLLMVAQRTTLGSRPIALSRDPDSLGRERLLLLAQERDPEDGAVAEWIIDPLVKPVVLPDAVNADGLVVVSDGEMVDLRAWPLALVPGEPRPDLEIVLVSRDGSEQSVLRLASFAMLADRTDSDESSRRAGRRPGAARVQVDLDSAGRSQEDW